MLKVVVYDGGFGGELFADLLEEEVPVFEVVRVIDWRNAEMLNQGAKTARKVAERTLQPYLEKVDLIVLANHLLSVTSLRYFRRKYPKQKFVGINLELPTGVRKRDFLVLTTQAMARTMKFRYYRWRLRAKVKILKLDTWPRMIDDGELSEREIAMTFETAAIMREQPRDVVLACATFRDVTTEINGYFNQRVRVYDGFEAALKATCRMLRIRGGIGKK